MNSIMVDDNFKDHLMRHCQTNNLSLPEYRVLNHENGIFYIDVYVDNVFLGRGHAKNKKQAEQHAAKRFFLSTATSTPDHLRSKPYLKKRPF